MAQSPLLIIYQWTLRIIVFLLQQLPPSAGWLWINLQADTQKQKKTNQSHRINGKTGVIRLEFGAGSGIRPPNALATSPILFLRADTQAAIILSALMNVFCSEKTRQ
jgi:hypothetical protein